MIYFYHPIKFTAHVILLLMEHTIICMCFKARTRGTGGHVLIGEHCVLHSPLSRFILLGLNKSCV